MRLGKKMLEKCDGLPLAITTLAGLLGSKTTIQQWEDIKERVILFIMKDDEDSYETVRNVLELSYSDLPYDLKRCFLYLGIYKEDESIRASELINLWVAEGFIKGDDQSTLEEAGMDILEEFAQRCMVKALKMYYEGDEVYFHIHDLIRDFCIKKAKKEGGFQVSSTTTTPTQFEPSSYRAIINNGESLALDNLHLRTLVYIGREDSHLSSFERLKLLRVLSLNYIKLGESAKHIGNMVLLRYLKLVECCSEVENVYFIKLLANLQYLCVSQYIDPAIVQKLPNGMVSNMEQLRILDLTLRGSQEELSARVLSGVTNLRNMQTLRLDPACQGLFKEPQLARNIDLRELLLWRISSQQHLDAICGCVTNNFLPLLKTLVLLLDRDRGQPGLGFDMQKMKWGGCQHLRSLYLNGKMIKSDEPWLPPPKLLSLTLYGSKIEDEEDMERVINPQLSHLRELVAYGAFNGDKLSLVGLPQVEKLDLIQFKNMKELRITQGSLSKLRSLEIRHCPELKRIPDEIGNIHSLQALTFNDINEELEKRIKKREEGATQGGEDFHLINHIPTFTIH